MTRRSVASIASVVGFAVLVSFLWLFFCPSSAPAATGKQRYIAADHCYKQLRNSPTKQKYRENWLKCIDKYQAVYSRDPSVAAVLPSWPCCCWIWWGGCH
ncbi:MAG: hypothetical protein R6V54_00960 [Desulfobacteraceae bacterium]